METFWLRKEERIYKRNILAGKRREYIRKPREGFSSEVGI
jgi:hypothetical protein